MTADTVAQLERLRGRRTERAGRAVRDGQSRLLDADRGVVGLSGPRLRPRAFGYDIACGNLAVQTNLSRRRVPDADMRRVRARNRAGASASASDASNTDPIGEHPVFDRVGPHRCRSSARCWSWRAVQARDGSARATITWTCWRTRPDGCGLPSIRQRGFGYKTAKNGFMNIAQKDARSTLDTAKARGRRRRCCSRSTRSRQDYLEAMAIAGEYALRRSRGSSSIACSS